MSTLIATETGVVTPCGNCGTKNRIPYEKLSASAQCGKCHTDIPSPSSPIDIESEAAFDKFLSASPLPLVVDFWAPWCPPCRAVAPEFEKVAQVAAGHYFVAKIDTQALPALGARYRIESIPAMVVFAHGRETGRTVGARPSPKIDAFVRQSIA